MDIVILDAFTTDQGDGTWWEALRALGRVTAHARTPPAQVAARIGDADIALTNKAPIDAATVQAAPRLRYVGVMATGWNIVDVTSCRARGVAVTNVPGYSTAAVAQQAIALVLHLTNDVAGHDRLVKSGGWASASDFCVFTRPIRELAGRTLVVVGLGAIGSALAGIARALGMRVIAAQVPGSASAGRTPLAEALPQADVVSLHCPLSERTRNLVDAAFLAALKPGAILVNTGRGALIDEAAVVAALASGRLGGVALDVLASEPPPAGHPLCDPRAPWAARVVVTPHVAWGAEAARRRLVAEVAANLAAFARGERRNRID